MRKYYLLIILFFVSIGAFAQDAAFSQVSNTFQFTQPSNVIMNKRVVQIQTAYHKQWMGLGNDDFNTLFAGIHMPFPSSGLGVGLSLMQDVEGVGNLKTQQAKLTTRYNLIHRQAKSKHQLVAAIDVAFIRKNLGKPELIFANDLNPVFGVNPAALNMNIDATQFLDLSAGFTWTNANLDLSRILNNDMVKNYRVPFSFSFTAHHISRPTESLLGINTRLPVRLIATATTSLTALSPDGIHLRHLLFQYDKQSTIEKFTAGAALNFAGEDAPCNVYIGAYYVNSYFANAVTQNTDGYVFLIGTEIGSTDRYNICLSYDYNNRGLSAQSGGIVEVTLNITAKKLFKTIVNCFAYKHF
ncbi:MAG: PorP/SprF family type IX secretion system membrane protein [Bacteroidia bacterium]|nr:PorP/SprF family type IX secretion system membrane protein [Bacteroidia bacterium]